MKHLLTLIVIVLVSVSARSQVNITFICSDAITGQRMQDVSVTCGEQFGITNARGTAELQVAAGEYSVYFSFLGYQELEVDLNLSADQKVKVSLEPSTHVLTEFELTGTRDQHMGIRNLRDVEGSGIYSGKKTELIRMDRIQGNKALNNARQIYSRVAGLNIWESDAGGLQLGIGGRGLSPNRTSNFNTRQNGYDIAADALGYPESYYTPPSEAVREIQVVRGAASLQYGPQFGGMVNFNLNKPPVTERFEFISRQTGGSWNLFNTFNSIGGSVKRFSYYAFYHRKTGDGWRENSGFENQTLYGHISFRPTKHTNIAAEFTRYTYLAQQPGGLTDQQFEDDPRSSYRDRNWFRIEWNIVSLQFQAKLSNNTNLESRFFGLLASRESLGYLGAINRFDPGEERDLIYSQFLNWGNESRLLHRFKTGKVHQTLLTGIRFYQGHTENRQGVAPAGDDANFVFQNNDVLQSDHTFPSTNVSVFAEDLIRINHRLSITPGARFEYIQTRSSGTYAQEIRDLAGNLIERNEFDDARDYARSIVLLGIGTEYHLNEDIELYANWSQNYRAINFNDMRIQNPNFRIDTALQDERGFSTDIGFRGRLNRELFFDLSGYYVHYANRIGLLSMTDPQTYITYLYRTNIAASRAFGIEGVIETDIMDWFVDDSQHHLHLFVNGSYTHARYFKSDENGVEGNWVEQVPPITLKSGISYIWCGLKLSYQYSYTAQQYTDATNTEFVANAIYGLIPTYAVHDVSASYEWRWFTLETGINNLLDNNYFTRRATAYPGPGILPSEGRSFFITLQLKLNQTNVRKTATFDNC